MRVGAKLFNSKGVSELIPFIILESAQEWLDCPRSFVASCSLSGSKTSCICHIAIMPPPQHTSFRRHCTMEEACYHPRTPAQGTGLYQASFPCKTGIPSSQRIQGQVFWAERIFKIHIEKGQSTKLQGPWLGGILFYLMCRNEGGF